MSTTTQLKRGNAAQVAAYQGPQGEVVVDTTNNRVVLQDGATAGGIPLTKKAETDALQSSVNTLQANAVTTAQLHAIALYF